MNPRLAGWLVHLYPRYWRERYGEEFESLLQTSRGDLHTLCNIAWSALHEHISPVTKEPAMKSYPDSVIALSKLPSAFVPVAMSLAALGIVLGSIGLFGVVHKVDEGAAAHLWQLLMAGQIPVLAFFVIKWLPRVPRRTLCVVALQAGAALASMAPVFLLGL